MIMPRISNSSTKAPEFEFDTSFKEDPHNFIKTCKKVTIKNGQDTVILSNQEEGLNIITINLVVSGPFQKSEINNPNLPNGFQEYELKSITFSKNVRIMHFQHTPFRTTVIGYTRVTIYSNKEDFPTRSKY